jgi:CheY-like chemotaxis protein
MTLGVSPDASDLLRCHTEAVEINQPEILVVDDHAGFRAFARVMLEAAGFTVAEAANAAEASEQARVIRPALVLLDIGLPDLDGFEVARRLAVQDYRPVIVLTSTRDASDYGGRIADSPAAGFLPKDQLSGAALRGFMPDSHS